MYNKKYNHFGVMLDCSRNAVKSVDEIKRFVDNLAKMGYNTLELYTEDTYKIESEPYFGYLRGGYSAGEIKIIDEYCKKCGIELIPCVQTLAHLDALLNLPQYSSIKDIDNIVLIDEPKTYELIDKIFAFCSENFTSREINIGFDEAHMVGLGNYLDKHGFQDRYEVLLRHLNKVVELAKKYGFKPHMWSDMFFRMYFRQAREKGEDLSVSFNCDADYYCSKVVEFPDKIIEEIPDDVSIVYWDYYNNKKSVYDSMFESHKNLKKDIWFAGGAWTWMGFVPFNKMSLDILKPAMQSVVENNIENVLITMWGDDGGEGSYNSALATLYAARRFANGEFDLNEIKTDFYKLFGINFDSFLLLDVINDTNKNIVEGIKENPAKVLFYNDIFLGINDIDIENCGLPDFRNCAILLQNESKKAGEFSYIFDTLSSLAKFLEVKAYLGIETRKAYKSKDKNKLLELIVQYEVALKRLKVFYKKYKDLWYRENKPFGFEVQAIRVGGLIQRIKDCKEILTKYCLSKISVIPELEENILPYCSHLRRYYYQGIASVSKI